MAEIREVANVLIGLGNGDTDPGRVYMQQMIINDWVSFPVESLPDVIAALQATLETTMGTKNNPGSFDCYHNAEPDEPMFILLARDPLAPSLVKMWADLRAAFDIGNPEKIREAEECADAMLEWAANHPDHGPLAK